MPAAASSSLPAVRVRVDASHVVNGDARNRLGINTNYWWDSQENRAPGARSFSSALQELNFSMLRYPGGEEADGYLWSQPPYLTPAPSLARISKTDWPS